MALVPRLRRVLGHRLVGDTLWLSSGQIVSIAAQALASLVLARVLGPVQFGAYALVLGHDVARARDIWRRKFREPPSSREERAKQMRFLQSRGFSFEIIRQVMAGTDDDANGP